MSIDVEATLMVNGDPLPLGAIETVGALLSHLQVAPERVVVELNGVIQHRGEGLDEPLKGGDVVEIVHFVGGG